jgi:general secretion pathway protein C
MAVDQLLKRRFGLALLPVVALAALLNAQAVSQLVGVVLMPDEKDLARPPPAARAVPTATSSARVVSADPILARNPFDHVTGPLRPPPGAEGPADGTTAGPIDTSDVFAVPTCEGVDVNGIVASDDEDWSLCSLSSTDGKTHLRRRGDDIAGKKVHFIGWDRVWLESSGSLCQAKLFDQKAAPAAAPVASVAPAPAASDTLNPRRGKPVDPDIKKGIQKVSETEYNVDRGTLDKILENQADLMRQARVTPVQENGRTVGIRMNGIREDSLLGTLGMKNGDQLRTINGFDMSSPEKALEAYARLRTADKLTVQINRGGKNMNLDYSIR